jgi:uncharacterized RDD family membrane protein YckC
MTETQDECSGSIPDLAPRWMRALAAAIDWALATGFSLLGLLGLVAWGLSALARLHDGGKVALGGAFGASLAGCLGAALLLLLYQWLCLSARGQTLGKQLLGIQIVDDCAAPAGFFRALLLRVWVFGLLAGLAALLMSRFRAIGLVLFLADALPIFGPEQRCLHDYLAGTRVRFAARAGARGLPALAFFLLLGGALCALLATSGKHLPLERIRYLAESPDAVKQLIASPATASGGAWQTAPGTVGPLDDLKLSAPKATGRIYEWKDASGGLHYTDDLSMIPAKQRRSARQIE